MTTESDLRAQVREFLATTPDRDGQPDRCDSWMTGFSPEFSRALGSRGWIGMTWPRQYGGGEASERDRLVVIEELLASGAPVAAHWFADRQIGPGLLARGSQTQRERYLPEIAAGRSFFSIGMSEPDSGSDLASIRTRATRSGSGWVVNGSKIWTSHAHHAHFVLALVRTQPPDAANRHAGMSQVIIDLSAPGVSVRPVITLDGEHHLNEVVFTDVELDQDALVGNEGDGWGQVVSELAYERSGPERYMSTLPLLRAMASRPGIPAEALGELAAGLQTLRALSRGVADALERGESPMVDAALVKDLGSRFERLVIDQARALSPVILDSNSPDDYTRLLTEAVLHDPERTLRGGTNEILRGIIAGELVGR